MNNIYLETLHSLEGKASLVLATLLKTRGSTPQVPGASALFTSEGLHSGTLGGGILEGEAQRLAIEANKTKKDYLGEFSLDGNIRDEAGAICGGHATFLLDAHPERSLTVFQQMKASLKERKAGLLITRVIKGEEIAPKLFRFWVEEGESLPADYKPKGVNPAGILKQGTIEMFEDEEALLIFEPILPRPQLLIVGAGHIGKALCNLASTLDFETVVLDPRKSLATWSRFPLADKIVLEEISKGFEQIAIGANTYIVIVTRGHREDGDALKACIRSRAAYIGMIGSRRKVGQMREQFLEEAWATPEEWNRIYAPVGLDIHAETVPEIAISIAAQLVQVRRSRQKVKRKKPVWSLVLAAGKSTRMKQQKLLLPWEEKSIVETVVEKAKNSRADEVLVVLGSHREEVAQKLQTLNPILVDNPNYEQGMLSSVQTGIQKIPAKVGAAIVLLGDQPMVRTDVIDLLIRAYHKGGKGIILPRFEDRRGHPLLVDLKYKEEILKLDPQKGLRELLHKYPEDIEEVEVATESILKDLDTPEEYQKELK